MSFCLEFPYSLGKPGYRADFRAETKHFIVNEDLGFEPSGDGEHLYLKIQKENENTHWIAENIARQAGVKVMDVGYCGKKDRNAITTQWYSIYDPKRAITQEQAHELGRLNPDGSHANCRVLAVSRHTKKLRRGEHRSNFFEITLANFVEDAIEETESRLRLLLANGTPNYFGEQRFGRDGNNLEKAERWATGALTRMRRNEKSMVISAARSWLFNLVLSERVKDETWSLVDDGPLWGRGALPGLPKSVEYESKLLAPWHAWCHALEHCGLSQERRSLLLFPEGFAWEWQGSNLILRFGLPAGQFATAVLREVADLNKVNLV